MTEKRRVPVRKCLACQGRTEKSRLWRFVWDAARAELIWDRERKLPGRGAYLHAALSCVSRAGELRQWARALRLEGAALQSATIKVALERARGSLPVEASSSPVSPQSSRRGRVRL